MAVASSFLCFSLMKAAPNMYRCFTVRAGVTVDFKSYPGMGHAYCPEELG